MTEAEQNLVNLIYFKKKVIKPFYEAMDKAISEVIIENGLMMELEDTNGESKYVHCFQDDNGVCYQVEPCKGKYIPFSPHTVVNTRTTDEEKGLSSKHPKVFGLDASLDVEMAYSEKIEDIIQRLVYVEA